jgi:hypothetical protein
MINAGIRHLFRKACPGVEFVSLPMMRPWAPCEHELAKTCDLLILAGNPRYDGGEHKWLYSGVMDQMIAAGRPMVDAWQGAAVATGNGIEYDARQLLGNPRNQEIIDRLRHFSAIITRDNLAQRVNELAGLPSVQLPCSSWWAAAEYGVERVGGTDNVLIANNVKCTDSVILGHSKWRVVATSRIDFERCETLGVKAELVFKPLDILNLFARADTVVSCRLHAGIPAASLGCKTALIAIDTRAQAGDAFGIPWVQPNFGPVPGLAVAPKDPSRYILKLIEDALS